MSAVVDSRDFDLNRRMTAAFEYLAETGASIRRNPTLGFYLSGAFGIRASLCYPSPLEAVEAAIKTASETVADPAPAVRRRRKAARARNTQPDPAAVAVTTHHQGI